MNKRDSIDSAKTLLKEGKAHEASKIFNEVQESFPNEIDHWDVFYMLKCDNSDKGENSDKVNNLSTLAEKFIEDQYVKNLYIWYLYYKYGKKITPNTVNQIENNAKRLLEIGIQKDYINCTDEERKYPCPYTLIVTKLIKAYKKPNFNLNKVQYYLTFLDPEKLSRQTGSMTDDKGKDRELASDFEDYYATISKLKLIEEKHQECIDICNYTLQNINNLHYNNDIWLKRRKALSMIKLGNEEEGFELLLSVSQNRQGGTWFIYKEIADIYFENEDWENSLKYCKKGIEAYGNEEMKINLMIVTARILFKLQRMDDATILAKYMVGMSLVHELKEKNDLKRIVDYFKIDKSSIEEPKKYLSEYRRKVDEIFQIDRNVNKNKKKKSLDRKSVEIKPGEEVKGWVKTVHGNGKSGHVIANKEAYFFSMNDVQADKDKIEHGVNVMLGFKDAKDRDGKPAKHAVILNVIE